MALIDSFDYELEKWKYQSIFGVRKIVLFYTAIALVALLPAYGAGNLIASTVLPRTTPPTVTQLVTAQPRFTVEPASVLSYAGNKRGFFVRVSNRSDEQLRTIGYKPWIYNYVIRDINNVVVRQGTNSSYLLPNSDTYVIGPIITEPGISFEINTDTTRSVATRFELAQSNLQEIPIIETSNSSFQVSTTNPNLLDIRFTLNNTSQYDIRSVDCIFLLRNVDRQIIGIGKFVAEKVNKKEIRQVALTYPAPNLGTNTTLEVIPQINYLDEENIKLNVKQ